MLVLRISSLGHWNAFYFVISFFLFLASYFLNDICHLMSQMNMTKKNMTNLGLNPGQLVRRISDWVECVVGIKILFTCHAFY